MRIEFFARWFRRWKTNSHEPVHDALFGAAGLRRLYGVVSSGQCFRLLLRVAPLADARKQKSADLAVPRFVLSGKSRLDAAFVPCPLNSVADELSAGVEVEL
jgi:hypothetical protein